MKMKGFAVAGCVAAAYVVFGGVSPVSQEEIRKNGFTIRCCVDFSEVKTNETLYAVGPVRLGFRFAGREKKLEGYDRYHGNYLNFPMPDGSCPVIEATVCSKAGRVGIPLGALARKDGVHEVTLNFDPPRWMIHVDGITDEDMPRSAEEIKWPDSAQERILSSRVKSAELSVPALKDALPEAPASKRVTRSIQYWTPDDHNAWVGDVVLGTWRGRFHVFYLFDRRHHGSGGGGAGRHYFAHLSSADLVSWDEHPAAVPIDQWWETMGTGTPFEMDGRYHLAYGVHTSRLSKDKRHPRGATYAVSEDGIHFRKSHRFFHKTENPTIYNRKDGLLGLVTGYGMKGCMWKSDHLGDWKLHDDKMPVSGDCPCFFDWNGRAYIFQGFDRFAYSPTGEPGTFVSWTKNGLAPYEGLSVPMVAPFGDNRRIMSGWLRFLGDRWGGWLVFRELIQYPDGTLGTKWVPEVVPPVRPETHMADPGKPFKLVFRPEKGDAPALIFTIDPVTRTAAFADDVPDVEFKAAHIAGNFRISNIPCFKRPYPVRVIRYFDRKAGGTVFDVEVGGERTMICRRPGKFRNPER